MWMDSGRVETTRNFWLLSGSWFDFDLKRFRILELFFVVVSISTTRLLVYFVEPKPMFASAQFWLSLEHFRFKTNEISLRFFYFDSI